MTIMERATKNRITGLSLLMLGIAAAGFLFATRNSANRRSENASAPEQRVTAAGLNQPTNAVNLPRPKEATPLRADERELLRLRGELAALRTQLKEAEDRSQASANQLASRTNSAEDAERLAPGKYLGSDAWQDIGQASPTATIETALWASKVGSPARFADVYKMSPDKRSMYLSRITPDKMDGLPWAGARGATVLKSLDDSQGGYLYVVKFDSQKEDPLPWNLHVIQGEQGWQIDSITQTVPADNSQ